MVTRLFQTLHAFVIVHLGSRRVVHGDATAQPTDAWVAEQLRDATPLGDKAKHLICDYDAKYGPVFHATAKTCGLDIIQTLYQAPRANAICERCVGSLRRECLDHVLVLGNLHLVRMVQEYADFFNPSRPHQGLAQQTPDSRMSSQATVTSAQRIEVPVPSPVSTQRAGRKLIATPVLNCLHHNYSWTT